MNSRVGLSRKGRGAERDPLSGRAGTARSEAAKKQQQAKRQRARGAGGGKDMGLMFHEAQYRHANAKGKRNRRALRPPAAALASPRWNGPWS
ncbi:hypothetical protein GCM10008966_20040 [Rhodovulum strictum]